MRIGIQLSSLRQPFKTALQTAARLGADTVTINARSELQPGMLSDTALRQIRKQLTDLNLKVATVEFPTRHGYNVEANLDRRIEATKSAMSMAYALGASFVVNSVGFIPQESEGADWNLLLAALTDIGRHGQKCGAMLAARTGSTPGAELRRLLDALPKGSVVVSFDPGQLIVNGFSASEALGVLASDVQHVHARDAVRDLAQGRGVEVPLGQGVVDFPAILATLDQANYRGSLTVERRESDDALTEIGNAVAYLRQLQQV
jgi:sugar phosphate isomerase/epimerase